MFYETSFISNLLKCQHCSQSYDQFYKPRILSCCGNSICDTCIESLEKNVIKCHKKYKCVLCLNFGYVPVDGFPINQLAVKLASEQPKEAYRGKEIKDLKLSLNCLEQLNKKLVQEIENADELNIDKHWDEQIIRIQSKFDTLIQDLITQKEILIKKVNELRVTCKESFKSMSIKQQTNAVINKVGSFLDEQRNFLNQIQIDDEQILDSNKRLNMLTEEIEKERIHLTEEKIKMSETNLIEFKSRETPDDLLGYFDFKTKIVPTKSVS